MAATIAQSNSGTGNSITLNGVTSGNAVVVFTAYFRATGDGNFGTAEGIPTDSAGTLLAAIRPTPIALTGAGEIGSSIFYLVNAASGTHTITMQTLASRHWSIAEFAGLSASASLDQATSASTANSTPTSQATGTTSATTVANELVLINLCDAALAGSANIGLTDPVSGFTTIGKSVDSSTTLATMPSYKNVSATGTQTATFNWTDNESGQSCMAVIATLTLTGGAGGGGFLNRNFWWDNL